MLEIASSGCIIRAKLLDEIQSAPLSNPHLLNLMVDPLISMDLGTCEKSLRSTLITCTEFGIACPSLSGSLNYYDSYRTANLPANFTQTKATVMMTAQVTMTRVLVAFIKFIKQYQL